MKMRWPCFAVALFLIGRGAAQHTIPITDSSSAQAEGKNIFAANCSVGYCHGLEGRAGKGPRLRDRVWARSYLRQTIEKGIPGSSMPAWDGRLSSQNIDAVIAYILSISTEQKEAPRGSVEADARRIAAIEQQQTGTREFAVGKELFFDPTRDRNCGVCHRVGNSGALVAAELSNLLTLSASDLLRRITEQPATARLLRVHTRNGDAVCGVKVDESRGLLRIYDLAGEGPPVLRSFDLSSIVKQEPCVGLNVHEANARIYTADQLAKLVVFLQSPSLRTE